MPEQTLSGKKYFELNDEQRLSWLRLIRSQNVGPVTFRDLISHYGSAGLALEALPDLAKRGGAASRIRVCPLEDAEREMAKCLAVGARYIAVGEPQYPQNLRHSDHAPPLLCVLGDDAVLSQKCFSIVGSRNASITGLKITERISRQIGEAGYCIVSGLARGIDAAAHKAALGTGTIAVFAGGVDHIFPEENKELAARIVDQGGAIVSEMPISWQPRSKDFPRRNRIVTGLSSGLLVVEAATRSGSLITARLANEMGRLVMAVPGSPLDPRSEGTNGLIKQGATLITGGEDILEALAPLDGEAMEFVYDLFEGGDENQQKAKPVTMEDAPASLREAIVASLGPSPVEVDDIIHFTGATAGQVQLVLLELALAGRLVRHTGNKVSLSL